MVERVAHNDVAVGSTPAKLKKRFQVVTKA
jgi:hypothetical protein